jgi:hypothetical protein
MILPEHVESIRAQNYEISRRQPPKPDLDEQQLEESRALPESKELRKLVKI